MEQRQGQKKRQLPEFFFTDKEVLVANDKRGPAKISGMIPFPDSLKKCEDHDILFAWNLWYHLALMIHKKLRSTRKEIKKTTRKNPIIIDSSKPLFTFGHKDGIITLTIQPPPAAQIMKLPEIKVFPCPPYCITRAYTEAVLEMNGHSA